ncbi:prepilin-type N-terminal cleavage/methylation domain-containing protein [Caproiciproducens galactitolivorans]|uniref:Prepilin-type N-terminal cleavage/methylation domain-containing protein n=1 Tax=Caproiciproducens galactitolivorans TaxID=642589 RepID=A0ABT4BU51_9FIRM|nr:prepilin-type N-terminal cleavage/methylation domain-containing protein [Caproiciproducens galactitolivorans]MCY1714427.1 prepilin-type N-terminal cleavage/methylation domain-containing protein [Caproiciproducens galactitolivorans]
MKNKKGLTLAELIIAVAFTAVVISAACAMLLLSMNFSKTGAASAMNQQKTALAESYIQRYAPTAVKLSREKSPDANGIVFTLSDNILHISEQRAANGGLREQRIADADGIAKINFQVENQILHYSIVSQDGAYTLSGGIILNNCQDEGDSRITVDSENGAFLEFPGNSGNSKIP